MPSNISSIAQALANETRPIVHRNASGAEDGKALLPVSAAKHIRRDIGLPTPPNSISPNLPPQGFRAKSIRDLAGASPLHVESDIDLEDAVDHAKSHDFSLPDPSRPIEGHGIITPGYLARNHLPNIVLDQGPIAIRTVMNKLAESVPGFSDIPPAKARRIVVSALESRSGGGPRGDVEFEKVGWGKWDAKIKGQPSTKEKLTRDIQKSPLLSPTLSAFSFSRSNALRIPGAHKQRPKYQRQTPGSWVEETALAAQPVDPDSIMSDMPEDEADKMSIDGDDELEEPGSPTAAQPLEIPSESDTDEEDWAAMGAAALRESSSSAGGRSRYFSVSARPRSRLSIAISTPSRGASYQPPNYAPLDFTGVDADSQERAAIEALMRMGSM